MDLKQTTLAEVIALKTGETIPLAIYHSFEQKKQRYERLEREFHAKFASKADIPPRKSKNKVSMVGLLDGHVEIQNRPALPLFNKHQPNRALMLNAAKAYFSTLSNCRLFVVTGGKRVEVSGIRERCQTLSRKISKLSDKPWFGGSFSVELRSLELPYEDGTFHVHQHVVIQAHRKTSDEDWEKLEQELRDYFDSVVLDSGELKNPAQAIPYLYKDEEYIDAPIESVVEASLQVQGLKLIQPLGGFADFWRKLKRENLKVVPVKGRFKTVKRSAGRFRHRPRKGVGPRTHNKPILDFVVNIGTPRFHGSNVKQPVVYVVNYGGDLDELCKKFPPLGRVRDEVCQAFSNNSATNKVPYNNTTVPASPTSSVNHHDGDDMQEAGDIPAMSELEWLEAMNALDEEEIE